MKQQRQFFDERACKWEENCYPEPVRKRLVKLIEAFQIRRGTRVLDVGTGPGVLLPYLRQNIGEDGRLFAFDISMPMLREAAKKQPETNALIFQGDVQALPLEGKLFDHVICFAAFPHFEDKARALRELAQAVRPGGTLTIAHLMSRQELAEHHGTHEVVADDLLPNDGQMTQMLQEAGLAAPEITDLPGRYLAQSVR